MIIKLIDSSAIIEKKPTPDLSNMQNVISRKLSELNIYTTGVTVSMTAGKYPDITIEGILNTELWPK